MAPDIRNFFGPKGGQGAAPKPAKPAPKPSEDKSNPRKRRSRKVVDDSDDDDDTPIKAPPKPQPKKKQKPEEPKAEPTTTSEYFSSSKKSRKPSTSTDIKQSKTPNLEKTALVTRESPRKAAKNVPSVEIHEPPPVAKEEVKKPSKVERIVDAEEHLGGDDIFASEFQTSGKADDDYEEDEGSDFDDMVVKPPTAVDTSKTEKSSPALQPNRKVQKRKSAALSEDEGASEDDGEKKKKTPRARASKTASKSTPKKPRANKVDQPESKEIQDILNSIPEVKAPSPPTETKKFNFAAAAQRAQSNGAIDNADLPVGEPNCLAGLSFVFTGILQTLGREQGQTLVKKYGGKSMTAPSSKTSYVVLGSDAGPKKLETIQKYKLKTINEEGLFELIRKLPANGGDGKAAIQYAEKKKAEEQKIKEMAAEIDREEKKRTVSKAPAPSVLSQSSKSKSIGDKNEAVDDRLWTTKYAPTSLNMICGNKGTVEKLQHWLRTWHSNARAGFKKPGKDGSGTYRTVMIHGPPGIGKTTAAHLVAKLENFDIVETNASDTRSKKLLETSLRGVLDTTSLQGYFSGEGKKVEPGKKNLVMIMDEVDGMSAGDRGGVGAVAAIAKKTRIPIILICNERRLPKMKPFNHVTFELPFRRPTAEQIRARLFTICYREGIKIPPQVLDGLIEGTHADIRQVINMLSTIKLSTSNLDYDQGKEMSKAWEKHVILKPWDIAGKILSAQMFAASSKSTLNEKIELYFNDHEFSYLMLQENYLKTNPMAASTYSGKERQYKLLELADKAAESISDGDLVDRMIHGSQQQWSLMPTHAAFSFVRPASFMAGNMMDRVGFTSWLGNNSKQGKMARQVKEIQGHMRLRASGDRHDVRQQYLPAIWNKTVRRMEIDGKEAVDEVIDFMDSYFLTRDDYDSITELGLGPMNEKNINIHSQTKATFTRLYNQRSHPLPFMKASSVVSTKKLPKVKPDLEDAIDESDDAEEILGEEEVKDEESDLDLKKDKYVKAAKAKKAGAGAKKAGAAKAKLKKPKKAANSDDDIDISQDEAPKKRGRKPKVKGNA
ncbi:replication factor C subunit 1 [Arthroderma uncinatum]|uniref:replication factor C subunit 1 n=1 Tax=Arthroderma uncinatum TaxID=74035 RepID=UPI00144A9A87|nr:replication factor C subunit 1 [Arthroderma uncinatum]KAF3482797.1 replication factor C subunit 1 [Arthroderma uncinatum]